MRHTAAKDRLIVVVRRTPNFPREKVVISKAKELF